MAHGEADDLLKDRQNFLKNKSAGALEQAKSVHVLFWYFSSTLACTIQE